MGEYGRKKEGELEDDEFRAYIDSDAPGGQSAPRIQVEVLQTMFHMRSVILSLLFLCCPMAMTIINKQGIMELTA